MPYKAKRPCGQQGCPNLTDGYYCNEHRKQRARQYNRFNRDLETAKRYGTQWRKIRAAYIAAHPLCHECAAQGRFTPATEVHHVTPLAEGGTHDRANLMALCHSCHSAITMAASNGRRS